MFLQHLCTPALVYLILGCIGAVGLALGKKKLSSKFIAAIVSLATTVLFTYMLDYICKTYGNINSWYALAILYCLPVVLGVIMVILAFFLAKKI